MSDLDSLNSVLYSRTGYRSLEQIIEMEGVQMEDCLICTDDGYKVNREGYTLCKKHYYEVEDVFNQKQKEENN